MYAVTYSVGLHGINGFCVTVETDVTNGLPSFDVVGLPGSAVREARDRVRSALRNTGYTFPLKRITVNLAPADCRKEGPGFDLAIAMGILASEGVIPSEALKCVTILGELALDGGTRPVRGMLPLVSKARAEGFSKAMVPTENAHEAMLVETMDVIPISSLEAAVRYVLRGDRENIPTVVHERLSEHTQEDWSDVRGHAHAKRALEISASGGHSLLFLGPPGAGKTMLAQRLVTILPSLTPDEALTVTKIHSAAGILTEHSGLKTQRPFRSVHHSVTVAGLIGGGRPIRPGEVSLAHRGVLFLDELPEFSRAAIESLRQPLQNGELTLTRATSSVVLPAKFQLVAAANPCPCGYLGSTQHECVCTVQQVKRYRSRISGPMVDRLDMCVFLHALSYHDLYEDGSPESSEDVRERVEAALARQAARYADPQAFRNVDVPSRIVRAACQMDGEAREVLRRAFEQMRLSVRAYDRIVRVAQTIADLEAAPVIGSGHVAEAIGYRMRWPTGES